MPTKKEVKALLKARKSLYRHTFRHNMGQVTLGDILVGPCRFFGPIDTGDRISDEEMFVRQKVGREILQTMDALPGQGCTISPDKFVAKILSEIGDENARGRSSRRNDRNN